VKRRRNPIRKTYTKLEISLTKNKKVEKKMSSKLKVSQEDELTDQNMESAYQTHTYGRSKTIFLPKKNMD